VFRDLGLSSVQLVQMTADLEDVIGREVPPTFLFDCPTIEDAVVHLTSPEPSGEAASHA
jgi:acyl carrier protein